MKKHALVLTFVAVLLLGVYLVGHPARTAAPEPVRQQAAVQKKPPAAAPKQTAPSFDKTKYSLVDPASQWVVVNKQRPLNPIDYAPTDLTAVGGGQFMRAAAAQAFQAMAADAKVAGFTLIAQSAYRSYATQVSVYNSEVKAYGQAQADSESARPGHSEHQTGWAVDIGTSGCYEDCFGTKPDSKWVLENAYKYGFILRYPSDKSAITGYRNEPWHFRYVGSELATEMHNTNIQTLEEFFGLPAAPNYP